MKFRYLLRIGAIATFVFVAFFMTERAQAIELFGANVSPSNFEIGTANNITLGGDFKTEAYTGDCYSPNADTPLFANFPRGFSGTSFRYDIINSSGTVVQSGDPLDINIDYTVVRFGYLLECDDAYYNFGERQDQENWYRFNNVLIPVSGLPVGTYYVAFSSTEGSGIENNCNSSGQFGDCERTLPGELVYNKQPQIEFTITSPVVQQPGNIFVQSNRDTCWTLFRNGGSINPGSGCGLNGGPYNHPAGNGYSLEASELACYSKDITSDNADNLPSSGTLTFTITYSYIGCPGSNFTLSVSKNGTGSGTVFSSPTGIDCGSDCSEAYPSGTVVRLTAIAASGSTFAGWGGECAPEGTNSTCDVTVTEDDLVTATFNIASPTAKTLTIVKAGTGSGNVTSNPAGIDCGSTCVYSYANGTVVTLTAVANTGSTFAGWSGGGCGGVGQCVVTMNADTTVTATFNTNAVFCQRNSQFIAQTINGVPYNSPTTIQLAPSTVYAATVQMKNLCDDVWTAAAQYGIATRFPHDNTIFGLNRDYVEANIPKNAIATFNFNITTPATPGAYNFQWRMVQEGVAIFGDYSPAITINVGNLPPSVTIENPISGSVVTGPTNIAFWTMDNTTFKQNSIRWTEQYVQQAGVNGGAWIFLGGALLGGPLSVNKQAVCSSYLPERTGCPNIGISRPWNPSAFTHNSGTPYAFTNGAAMIRVVSTDSDTPFGWTFVDYPITINVQGPVLPPTITTVVNSTCDSLRVQWSDNSTDESGFTVWRSSNSSSGFANISGNLAANTNSYTDNNVNPGETWFYQVKAFRNSPFSETTSNTASNIVLDCAANLGSSSKAPITVNGSPYTAPSFNDGDDIKFRITLNNSGNSNANIHSITDTLSCNFAIQTGSILAAKDPDGFPNDAVSITGSKPANCTDEYTVTINISGTLFAGGSNWVIEYVVDYDSVTIAALEKCKNVAVVNFSDATGARTHTLSFGPTLCASKKGGVPEFREVGA